MAEKKVYIGSVGPFLFDDTDPIDDEDGDFAGENKKGLRTNAPIKTSYTPADDDDMIRHQDLTAGLDLKIDSALFNANTILKADVDDTPVALEVEEERIVGRLSGGVITDLTTTEVIALLNLTGGDTSLLNIAIATYDDLQDWVNTTQSAGKLTGGGFTDNGDGTVSGAAGTGFIKTTDSDVAVTKFFDWSANTSISLTDNSANYVYVDYNAGSPQLAVSTSIPSDHNTKILLGEIFREGTDLHIVEAGQVISNFAKRVFWKSIEINGKFQRASGLKIGETGTRNISVTSGLIYAGLTKVTLPSLDTSGTDTFTYYYRDGSGGWTKVTSQTQIDNTHYDDGSGTLAELTTGSWFTADGYGVHWVYEDIDGDLFVVYGQGDYNFTEAQDAQPPSSIPDLLNEVGGLIAKIIIQKNEASFALIQSAFDNYFSPSAITVHNELSDIQGGSADEYYHLTETQHTNLVSFQKAAVLGSL